MTAPTLLVLAGGLGSRFGGLKQLERFGPAGETLIDFAVFDALGAGFDRVVFVIAPKMAAEFEDLIAARLRHHIDVRVVEQPADLTPAEVEMPQPDGRTRPWGTAHAVLAAARELDRPFAVVNADDFYGRSAYRALGGWLATCRPEACDLALVGFGLGATLSPYGPVTRGVCSVDGDGFLAAVEETSGLRRDPAGRIAAADGRSFHGGERVSMNMWGLTPAVLPRLREVFSGWAGALGTEARLSAELPIPTAVDQLIGAGEAACRVLDVDARWFGVTFREDRPDVVREVAGLLGSGEYPPRLFG